MMILVFVALAVLVPVATTTASPMRRQYGGDITNAIDANGASECPCVAAFPANVAAATGLLAAKGFENGKELRISDIWRATLLLHVLALSKLISHTTRGRRLSGPRI